MRKLLATAAAAALTLALAVPAAAEGKITVGASPTPHAEVLTKAAELLAEQGWELEITEFTDYIMPNEAVESDELDCNYFQHILYMEQYNEEKGTHLKNAGSIHYEPFGIYPGKKASLEELEEGDSIAVPNDTTNEARALLLLQDNGLLTLTEGAGLTATINDIEENPLNLEIVELEAATIPNYIQDVDLVVLNGNYALQAGLSVGEDSIVYESSDSEAIMNSYVNVVAVKEGNEENEGVKALVEVLKSDEMKAFMDETYDGAVVPFEDSADAEAAAEDETEAVSEEVSEAASEGETEAVSESETEA